MDRKTTLVEEEKLSRVENIVVGLATGLNQRELARRLGYHHNTVWKFAHRPDVASKVEQLRAAFREQYLRERL